MASRPIDLPGYAFPNLSPLRRSLLPPDFKLVPDLGGGSLSVPVTPPMPPTVATGDLITAAHENTVTSALNGLWTDVQALDTTKLADVTTAPGDLMARGASAVVRLPVGGAGTLLVADPASPTKMKWALASASGVGFVPETRQVLAGAGMSGGGPLSADVTLNALVTSVFGRTGAVVLTTADITAAGGVPATRTLTAGVGLTGGGDLSANRSFAVVDDTTNQRLAVYTQASLIGTRPRLNLIPGANITLTATDDTPNNRVNLTIAATVAAQTPWASDIDANGFQLTNIRRIGVAATGAVSVGQLIAGGSGQMRLESDVTKSLMVTGEPLTVVSRSYLAFQANSVEYMRILATGWVGINTTNPQGPLHVAGQGSQFGSPAGSIAAPTPANTNVILYNQTGGNWAGMGADGSGHMYFRTGLSGTPDARMIIASDGKVCIGNLLPRETLSVISANRTTPATATQLTICEQSNAAGYAMTMGLYTPEGSTWRGVIQAYAGGAGAPLLLNALGGFVGLNTANPLAACDVNGFLRLLPTTAAAPTSGLGLEIYVPQALDYARMLCFDRSGTGYRSFQIGTNNGQQLLLNKNGNVSIGDPGVVGCFLGVGTPTPTYRAHVYGNGGAPEGFATFTPSLNVNNAICIHDSAGSAYNGGAIMFTAGSATPYAAMRGLLTNGTGYGLGDIGLYQRLATGTEAMSLVMRISGGVVICPGMATANPGAGSKGLWADPADGYRVKFAV